MKGLKIGILLMIFFAMTGCLKKESYGQKEKIPYAVCKDSVLPKELKELIDESKEEAFHFTYSNKEYTYYVIGYGRQPGKGYKIRVEEATMDQDHVYVDTTLIGITAKQQKQGKSYPYIVLKSQYYEKDVVFR